MDPKYKHLREADFNYGAFHDVLVDIANELAEANALTRGDYNQEGPGILPAPEPKPEPVRREGPPPDPDH